MIYKVSLKIFFVFYLTNFKYGEKFKWI